MNGKSILVVDDDKEFLVAVARALRGAGFDVRTTNDSRTAPALVRGQRTDVVITDIMMPERDGVELIGELRKTTRGVRILAMSGRGSMGRLDLLQMAQTLGADDTLAKPFDPDELVAKVTALCGPRPA